MVGDDQLCAKMDDGRMIWIFREGPNRILDRREWEVLRDDKYKNHPLLFRNHTILIRPMRIHEYMSTRIGHWDRRGHYFHEYECGEWTA